MSKRTHRNIVTGSFAVVLVLVISVLNGCVCNFGGCAFSKFKETRNMSSPFEPNGLFVLATHNGAIKITGKEQRQCEIIATVHAGAPTEAEAKDLAEKVKIELVTEGKKLTVKITKPENLGCNRSISIDFDVTLPLQTSLDLTSHNGAIGVSNIIGNFKAATHNGSINVSNITGDIKATTHNGSVDTKEICGKINLTTHNGSIKIACVKSCTNTPDISAVTHNAGIVLEIPSDISAKIDAETHNGSIKSAIPVTVDEIDTTTLLHGTIGAGDGKIYLKTHNGSIKINAAAK